MRPRTPSASARKTRRWHGPDSGDATSRLCTEHLTEQEFRGRPAGNVACAAFAGGLFGLWPCRALVAVVGTVLGEWKV